MGDRARFLLALGLTVALGACGENQRDAPASDGQGLTANIELDLEAVLGDSAGPGYVVHTEWAVRDNLGRYWLGQYRDMIKVFDSRGKYVGTIGRAGEGPMEFRTPLPFYTDKEGGVQIADAGLPRVTIVEPDFTLRRTARLPVIPWKIAPLNEAGTFVVNAPVRSAEAVGHPLHIVRGSEIVGSFGAPSTGIVDPNELRREITVDGEGRIYSVSQAKLTVEIWTATGDRIAVLDGPEIGVDDPTPEPRTLYTPRSVVTGASVDSDDRLWVLVAIPSADWRAHMETVPVAGGRVRLRPIGGDASNVYDTRILVIDLASGAIVAEGVRPERFVDFLGDRLLLELRPFDGAGSPEIGIWKLSLTRR